MIYTALKISKLMDDTGLYRYADMFFKLAQDVDDFDPYDSASGDDENKDSEEFDPLDFDPGEFAKNISRYIYSPNQEKYPYPHTLPIEEHKTTGLANSMFVLHDGTILSLYNNHEPSIDSYLNRLKGYNPKLVKYINSYLDKYGTYGGTDRLMKGAIRVYISGKTMNLSLHSVTSRQAVNSLETIFNYWEILRYNITAYANEDYIEKAGNSVKSLKMDILRINNTMNSYIAPDKEVEQRLNLIRSFLNQHDYDNVDKMKETFIRKNRGFSDQELQNIVHQLSKYPAKIEQKYNTPQYRGGSRN